VVPVRWFRLNSSSYRGYLRVENNFEDAIEGADVMIPESARAVRRLSIVREYAVHRPLPDISSALHRMRRCIWSDESRR
jgi:hypothetical protein